MKKIKVLITGAFGNLGINTLQALFENPQAEITVFIRKSKEKEKIAKRLWKKGDFKIVWGDIRDKDSVLKAVDGQDCIIHLAALLVPKTEENPTLCREINVEGLVNVIEAAERQNPMPRFIFSSSITVMGLANPDHPPWKVTDPLIPSNEYSKSKIEGEKLLRESKLPWVIFRISLSPPFEVTDYMMKNLFEIPLDQKLELLHPEDAGVALSHAIDADVVKKILFLAGGESCRLTQREYLTKQFHVLKMLMLPESAFRVPKSPDEWAFMNWMETEESERLLNYQKHSFNDYLEEYKEYIGFKRHIIKLVKKKVLETMLKTSPYYKKQ